MTIGQMLYLWLTKLEWFSTLFPRIPVPIQKQIETKINNYCREHKVNFANQIANQSANQSANPSANQAQSDSNVKQRHERQERHERYERSVEQKHGGHDRSKERQYNRNDEKYESRRGYRSKSNERERERDRDRDRDYRHRLQIHSFAFCHASTYKATFIEIKLFDPTGNPIQDHREIVTISRVAVVLAVEVEVWIVIMTENIVKSFLNLFEFLDVISNLFS